MIPLLFPSLLLAASILAPALPRDAWVGETIVTKRTSTNCYNRDSKGEWIVQASLPALFYTVKKTEKDYVQVLMSGKSVWVKKEDVVLLKEAPEYFTQLIDKEPEQPVWLGRRASTFHRLGKNDLAIKDYSEAIRLAPNSVYYYNNRGLVYASEKKFDEAIADYETAIKFDPASALPYSNRAFALTRKKEYVKAVASYEKALEIDDTSVYALNGLAWLLCTCPEEKVRDGKRAVTLAEKVCQLTNHQNGGYVDTLAAAYAEVKDFVRAVEMQEKAINVSDMPIKDMEEAKQRLVLYQSKMPYRTEK
jgi:tetratricopeptide (TPR) repeat protein